MSVPGLPLEGAEWVFLILVAVVLMAPVGARALRLPGLLGLIVAGMLVGPNVLGLVERDGLVALLGGAGLLFLMFMAGLELDLRGALGEHRGDTILFGGLTFAIPLTVGIVALLAWGFEVLAAILIASTWSSHTLVSYPIFQRLRLVEHRAVATAVGATMVTNVAALLVLAVVIGLEVGGASAESWVVLLGGLALLVGVNLWLLPRFTRWFFSGLGADRLSQVLFVLVVLFVASSLASLMTIEPIVGAFLAGLGLNDHVPRQGVLGERLTFLGDTLLIPVFLISVGMLIDPSTLVSGGAVLLLALTFAVQSLGGKFLAAVSFGRWRRYERDEVGVLYSLTSAEAAATLAAIFVGFRVGLFGQEVVDAVVLVILATCTISTLLAERYGPRLDRPSPRRALGSSVVVPVANPSSAPHLARVAAALASEDGGTVIFLRVLGRQARRADVDSEGEALRAGEGVALRAAVEAQTRTRIDDTTLDGIVHEAIEQDATAVLVGWKGYANRRENLFGGTIDGLLSAVDVPVVLCRPGEAAWTGRVLLASSPDGEESQVTAAGLAPDVARRIASHVGAQVVLVASNGDGGRLTARDANAPWPLDTLNMTADSIGSATQAGDVVVVPAVGQVPGGLDEVARRFPELTLIVVQE